ncbi:hypothetical protein [Thiothrix nivea]|uniref:Uncharacterized protein n=1 Tax=Thiothrix nivea (strain ATCC 35100 / DSM 5205 / JP2) TaxID=870187 RepID=A0A656HN68_THINJ|nr:hypothetical protein [Thiothrix nivea]EIJ36976.1 hypothetical protein Thini_4502 [Thiothrix nivea DSM 5205]
MNKSFYIAFSIFALLLSSATFAESLQDELFAKVIAGANCKQSINNGLICDYKVGDQLSFSIKDAGDSDTVIGFNQSDIDNEFYAVFYANCIVVVPGHAHPRNYDKDYGIYVSPNNGQVYQTKTECQAANKSIGTPR